MFTSLNVGTHWYKCDLHLHTPASKCFKDRTVTPEMWVQAALDADLSCVAVTDHNTAEWVDEIKVAAEGKLIVFPGVEITCSDAKVHLLVLFDRDKGKQHIEDFLISTGIDRTDFSRDTAHTNMNLEQTVELAISRGGLVIPAHIDEFNGLCEPANNIVKRLLKQRTILGVQVVHNSFLEEDRAYQANKAEFIKTLNRYYNVPEAKIDSHEYRFTEERMKDCRNAVLEAQKTKKAILTFSDNPHQEQAPEHGLWGIGKRYTWIKMADVPSLESLRQALLMHDVRIRNDFAISEGTRPSVQPEIWFKRITVRNTELSDFRNPELSVEFSPQMNTIIGGRGSGKSSLLQFIRGVFNRGGDLSVHGLEAINTEFTRFFKPKDKKAGKSGVLKPGCVIEVDIYRKTAFYKVRFTQISDAPKNYTTELLRFDLVKKDFVPDESKNIPYLFEFDLFSQKQIYEIALSPNSLRSRIDEADPTILDASERLELLRQQYVQYAATISTMNVQMQGKTKLDVEVQDLEQKIEKYRQSPVGELVKQFETLSLERGILATYLNALQSNTADFDELIDNMVAPALNIGAFTMESQAYFAGIAEQASTKLLGTAERLTSVKLDYEAIVTDIDTQINDSAWSVRFADLESRLNTERLALAEAGLDNYGVDIDITRLTELKRQQTELTNLEQAKKKTFQDQAKLRDEYVALRLELTNLRQAYLSTVLQDGNVKVEVKQCADTDGMEGQLRELIGADIGFEKDFEALVQRWDKQRPEQSNEGLRTTFQKLVAEQEKTGDFTKPFVNRLLRLNGEQLAELDLFFPEDDIRITYGIKGNSSIPISNASAGQKTAAILTILLSQGTKPLLMDQPEDDLDTGLISDLVVNRLHIAKQSRQIIVVTHNPNIPVNGDSEYIIVMDAEKKYLTIKTVGCIEDKEVKDEICRIMEGGMGAFTMRAERYQLT